ncbi:MULTISPECIES: cbb3-type cytochrome oxidase assembly protein CcoS [unclassified Chitinophaga]|uniref:cbb3-type cytochrome oxidase assembly protein CcoS n=1 Tax=unclassified Chitinophaga TaxID=2619133 RepID=UPI0009CB4C8A|nr:MULTISPECIES: cbb3-type cytochrome oxidase assembly protein CcoS [unclassified Chitinophaga]OMP79813.1 cytochrome oxidase maturation protein, cbb3-type [[Flexibacter] sp. ATCC 35208]WPV68624.1 cbb3-type cytochrome oxidase assembly protein CcoS [Chitinophaga sp. LS1]
MSVIILLLGASLLVAICFLAAFIWSVRSGQFEDHFSPAHRILFEHKPTEHASGSTPPAPSCNNNSTATPPNCKQ